MLLGAAAALGVVAYANHAVVKERLHLDPVDGIALIVLAAAGPVPALGLFLAGDVLYCLLDRPRVMAQIANVASAGWGLLAAAATLALLSHPAGAGVTTASQALALAVAGGAYITVNYAVTRGLVAVVADGQPAIATFRREFVPMLPAQVTVVLVGAVSASLSVSLGVVGLVPIVVAIISPQTMLALLTRLTPAPNSLGLKEARLIYAQALADAAGLSRRGRRQLTVLNDISALLQPDASTIAGGGRRPAPGEDSQCPRRPGFGTPPFPEAP